MIESEYRYFRDRAESEGVQLLYIFNREKPFGGCTVAWHWSTEHKNSKMITLAVSFCSEKDHFNRKLGAYNALFNLFAGKTIEMPINSGRKNRTDVARVLWETFGNLVEWN